MIIAESLIFQEYQIVGTWDVRPGKGQELMGSFGSGLAGDAPGLQQLLVRGEDWINQIVIFFLVSSVSSLEICGRAAFKEPFLPWLGLGNQEFQVLQSDLLSEHQKRSLKGKQAVKVNDLTAAGVFTCGSSPYPCPDASSARSAPNLHCYLSLRDCWGTDQQVESPGLKIPFLPHETRSPEPHTVPPQGDNGVLGRSA